MTRHLAIAYSIAGTDGPVAGRADVLDAEISHDPLRTPQIVVQATIPFASSNIIDDKSRKPANLYIAARTYNAGTLREFDAAAPAANLGALEWSDKASDPLALDGLGLDFTETSYELNLFCTKKVLNPHAGTADVTLASADYLLEHIANAGAAWKPAKHTDGNYRLKSALRQLLDYIDVPLTVPVMNGEGDVIFGDDEMKPWEPGQTALSWLNELRAAHGGIWMVSAVERTMLPYWPPGVPAPSLSGVALERTIESGTDISEVTGFARWCDGYLIVWKWTDDSDVEHVQRDFASLGGKPWQECRKINVEEFDRPPTSLTAASRLARAQKYDLQTTWVIPQAALPEPYLDLSTWTAMRGVLADLTYQYPAATVHATQTKE